MVEVLYFVAFILCIVVVEQVFRVYELILELKGGGSKDVVVTEGENKTMAWFYVIYLFMFFGMYAWCYINYKDYFLPEAASIHGEEIDQLLAFNFDMINIVFVITIIPLFLFPLKYYYRKSRKAYWYPKNHKLELIWTIVPSIAMAVVITWGLQTWNEIFEPAPEDAIQIELFAKQFDWTARYSGADGKLGDFNYRLIGGINGLGLDPNDENGSDDKIVKGEFHLPINKPVNFAFRSQDVIHSAYLPHFRVQMNCVPGMTTQFHFVPTKTTEEMREITGNPEFDYILLCNKICGIAHYNMQMTIVVESEEDYNAWLAEQKTVEEKGILVGLKETEKSNEINLLAENK